MPRQPRIEFEGACYHVINRGNYRSNIFRSDGDIERGQTQILEIFLYILRLTPFCVYRIRFR